MMVPAKNSLMLSARYELGPPDPVEPPTVPLALFPDLNACKRVARKENPMMCIIDLEGECQRSLFSEVKSADACWVDMFEGKDG